MHRSCLDLAEIRNIPKFSDKMMKEDKSLQFCKISTGTYFVATPKGHVCASLGRHLFMIVITLMLSIIEYDEFFSFTPFTALEL